MKLPNFKSSKGFTLIELLVVIAILAILAAVALTSYTSARKSANDARRKSDLQQYRNALQNYAANNKGAFPYNNCSTSPTICGTCAGNSYTPSGIFYSGGGCMGDIIPTYLPAVITDPSNTSTNNAYNYIQGSSAYVLYTELENGNIYWVVCSNGQSGTTSTAPAPTSPACPTLQ